MIILSSYYDRDCPVCKISKNNSKLLGILSGTVDPFSNSNKFDLSLCLSCDLIYLSKIPHTEDLFKMYTEHNQFDSDAYSGPKADLVLEFFSGRIKAILNKSNLDKKNLVTLEIGGGKSWLSKVVKNINENNFTVVNDITKELEGQLPWVDKNYIGDIQKTESLLATHSPYHIISMSHVFEHLIWPVEIIKLCKRLLDKNGIILITAPHRPLGWSYSKPFSIWENWSYNHTPAHLNYFNEKSLRKIAELSGLKLTFYYASSEEGQAFEAWLTRPEFQEKK